MTSITATSISSRSVDRTNGDISPQLQMGAACAGAFITSIFMTPLDVVKVRLQAQQREMLNRRCFLYCNGLMDHICSCHPVMQHGQRLWYSKSIPQPITGTLDGLVKIWRYEGITSLWSGLPPTLIVAIPNTVIYFTTYEKLRSFLQQSYGKEVWWAPGMAGGLARMWSVSVCSPVELIRTKMQASRLPYATLMVQLGQEVRLKGVQSLWRGWAATVLRDVPFSVMYWVAYEHIKRMFGQSETPSVHVTMFAGAAAGSMAATVTLPLDVVKTHRQVEIGEKELFNEASSADKNNSSGSTWRHLKTIYRQQGVKGLFSGLSPRLVKVMPACAIMITCYEYIKSYAKR